METEGTGGSYIPEFVSAPLSRNRDIFYLDCPDFHKITEWATEIADRMKSKKTDTPVVSIVVPAMNEECYLLPLLDSISCVNTNFPFEVVVVANNCTDGTVEIAGACGIRVIEYEGRQPAGVSLARQVGFEHARGEIILTTDADCIVPDGWIDAMVTPLYGDTKIVCTTGPKSHYSATGEPSLFSMVYDAARETKMRVTGSSVTNGKPTGSNMCFRRSDAVEAGGYDVRAKIREDYYLGERLSRFGDMYYIPGSSVWSSDRRFRQFDKQVLLWRALTNNAKDIYLDSEGNMKNGR